MVSALFVKLLLSHTSLTPIATRVTSDGTVKVVFNSIVKDMQRLGYVGESREVGH